MIIKRVFLELYAFKLVFLKVPVYPVLQLIFKTQFELLTLCSIVVFASPKLVATVLDIVKKAAIHGIRELDMFPITYSTPTGCLTSRIPRYQNIPCRHKGFDNQRTSLGFNGK